MQLSGSQGWQQVFDRFTPSANLKFGILDGRNLGFFERKFPHAKLIDASVLKHGLWDRGMSSLTPLWVREHPAFLQREKEAFYGMQRHLTGGSLSVTDIRVILSSLTDFMWSFFSNNTYSFGVITEAPHTHPGQILVGIAEALEIPILHFQQTAITSAVRPVVGPKYESVNLSRIESPEGRALRQSILAEERELVSAFAEEAANFRRYAGELELMDRERQTFRSIKGLARRFLIPFSWRVEEFRALGAAQEAGSSVPFSIGMMKPGDSFTRAVPLQSLAATISQSVQIRQLRRETEASQVVGLPARYVTFFLHLEPEKTSVPDGGIYGDQLAAVRACAGAISETHRLVVREHPSQLTFLKRGFRCRRQSFYRELCSIENVLLVGQAVPHERLMAESSAVVTLTGKVALEALANRIPAVALGFPWYSPLPGVFSGQTPRPLQDVFADALRFQFPEDFDLARSLSRLINDQCVSFRINPSQDKYFDSPYDVASMLALLQSFASRHA